MLLKQSVITKIAVQERREILEITLCKCFSHYHVVCTLLCIQSRYKTSDLNLLDKNKSLLNTYFFFFVISLLVKYLFDLQTVLYLQFLL